MFLELSLGDTQQLGSSGIVVFDCFQSRLDELAHRHFHRGDPLFLRRIDETTGRALELGTLFVSRAALIKGQVGGKEHVT